MTNDPTQAPEGAVSLRTWLEREGQLPFLEAVLVLRQLAELLASAHREGRFGGRLDLDAVHWLHGRVRWAAPPQPGAEPAGAGEHVQRFGAIAYQLLSGRPPREERPEPIARLRLHLPPGLARLVTRCLHADPRERWPSIEPMRDLLAGLVTPRQGYQAPQLVRQGRFLLRRRGTGLALALERFEAAAQIDPRCSGAHAGTAAALALSMAFGDPAAGIQVGRARHAAALAVELDSASAASHVAAGLVALAADWSPAQALGHFERAAGCDAGDGEALAWLAWTLAIQGGPDERALAVARQAARVDPSSAHAADVLGRIATALGDAEAGLAAAREAVRLGPAWPRLRSLGLALAAHGRVAEAAELLEQALQESDRHPHVLSARGIVHAQQKESERARAALEELLARRTAPAGAATAQPTALAQLAAWLGDQDAARAWTERAAVERDAAWWFAHLHHSPADWPARSRTNLRT